MSEKLTDTLEEQQYKRLYWESDVPLRDIKAPLMRKLIYAALILFVVLSVLSFTVKFPQQAELPFVLREEVKDEMYKYPYATSKNNKANYAFIKCSSVLGVKLRQAQACHLKFYSYPFYEYGGATGIISEINISADEKGEFNVNVLITDAGDLNGKLQPGLTGTAVIVIEEKTLFQYFFGKHQ